VVVVVAVAVAVVVVVVVAVVVLVAVAVAVGVAVLAVVCVRVHVRHSTVDTGMEMLQMHRVVDGKIGRWNFGVVVQVDVAGADNNSSGVSVDIGGDNVVGAVPGVDAPQLGSRVAVVAVVAVPAA